MTQPDPRMSAALRTYASYVSGNRPQFIDLQPGTTTIRMDQGDCTLRTHLNGYSVAAPDGAVLSYTYDDDGASFEVTPAAGPRSGGRWSYRDPANYTISLFAGDARAETHTDHNRVVLAIGEAIAQLTQLPTETGFRHFFYWTNISQDFRFEFSRRVRGSLPLGYFRAVKAATLPNFGCPAACFMCALMLETGPADIFWCALCVICIPSGGTV